MATSGEIAQFLAEVERRAYRQALYAVRDEQGALDIVQDSMLKLAEKYSTNPVAEYPMLFQRILQNTIRDYFRRQKVRNLWMTAVSYFSRGSDDQDDEENLEHIQVADEKDSPVSLLIRENNIALIEAALEKLPARQREAFLLRYWEDMDTAETAAVMGCSEGSVKTHCSRAVQVLAALLEKKGLTNE